MLWFFRVMLLVLPGLALAQDLGPAEDPPADFPSRQYIDSRGCVFLRDEGAGWAPRVSRDGQPICGYPPTLSVRGLDGRPRLRALDPNAGRSRASLLEEALTTAVLTDLRPGELQSDDRPMEVLPDVGPEPVSSRPADALRAALAAAPVMQREMGGALKPNLRLCKLLGYDGENAADRLAADPSHGYCASLPASDLSRLSFMRPIGSGDDAQASVNGRRGGQDGPDEQATGQAAVAGAKPASAQGVARPAGRPVSGTGQIARAAAAAKPADTGPAAGALPGKPVRAPQQSGKTTAQAAKTPKPALPTPKAPTRAAPPAGLIPAGARYVQLGTFANGANADQAAQRLLQMGYPALRGRDRVNGRDVQFIMAGPFNDRQTIVRALNAIRRAGYGDAFVR